MTSGEKSWVLYVLTSIICRWVELLDVFCRSRNPHRPFLRHFEIQVFVMLVLSEVALLGVRPLFWTMEAPDWLSLNAKGTFPTERAKEAPKYP